MSEFNNVNIVKKANVYFDGKVTSRTIKFSDGEVKTLGIMLPGEYEFNTDEKELMEIQSGSVEVLLPDQENWTSFNSNTSFEVKSKSSFKIKVLEITDYCCNFIK